MSVNKYSYEFIISYLTGQTNTPISIFVQLRQRLYKLIYQSKLPFVFCLHDCG